MIDTSTRNDNAAPDRSVDTAKAQDAPAPEVATAPASASCASDTPGEVVPIERMSFGSAAVGHLSDGKTVFVEGAVLGDVVRVELTEEKHRFARGHVAEIVEASPDRVTPPCAAGCGGAPGAPFYEGPAYCQAGERGGRPRAHGPYGRRPRRGPCCPLRALEAPVGLPQQAGAVLRRRRCRPPHLGPASRRGRRRRLAGRVSLAHRNIEGAPKALRARCATSPEVRTWACSAWGARQPAHP